MDNSVHSPQFYRSFTRSEESHEKALEEAQAEAHDLHDVGDIGSLIAGTAVGRNASRPIVPFDAARLIVDEVSIPWLIQADGLTAFSPAGNPHSDLKSVRCATINCSRAVIITDNGPKVVTNLSEISTEQASAQLFRFYDIRNGKYTVAHCSDIICTPIIFEE